MKKDFWKGFSDEKKKELVESCEELEFEKKLALHYLDQLSSN